MTGRLGGVPSSSSGLSPARKLSFTLKADRIVNDFLKPNFIFPPPEDPQFNYVTDIYTKWIANRLYFCKKYLCPSPTALSPSFEAMFTRLTYLGRDRFSVAYMRHTGEWCTVFKSLPEEECWRVITTEEVFLP